MPKNEYIISWTGKTEWRLDSLAKIWTNGHPIRVGVCINTRNALLH